jgi:hypothetical protein
MGVIRIGQAIGNRCHGLFRRGDFRFHNGWFFFDWRDVGGFVCGNRRRLVQRFGQERRRREGNGRLDFGLGLALVDREGIKRGGGEIAATGLQVFGRVEWRAQRRQVGGHQRRRRSEAPSASSVRIVVSASSIMSSLTTRGGAAAHRDARRGPARAGRSARRLPLPAPSRDRPERDGAPQPPAQDQTKHATTAGKQQRHQGAGGKAERRGRRRNEMGQSAGHHGALQQLHRNNKADEAQQGGEPQAGKGREQPVRGDRPGLGPCLARGLRHLVLTPVAATARPSCRANRSGRKPAARPIP